MMNVHNKKAAVKQKVTFGNSWQNSCMQPTSAN